MKRWRWMVVIGGLVTLVGCGSDSADNNNGGTPECPEGQRFNPILEQCTDAVTNAVPNNANSTQNNANSAQNNANNGANNVPVNNTTGINNTTGTNNTNPNNTMLACGTGALVGKSCAPTGEPLAAADVTISGIDCETMQPFELTARTMSDGTFEFAEVPSGQHQLTVEIGSFNSMRQVVIQDGMTTDLTSAAEKICLDTSVKIAVLGGSYDHVEGLLTGLNLTFESKGDDGAGADQAVAFLEDLNAMNEYDIIFVNCGNWFGGFLPIIDPFFADTDQIYSNLQQYVAGGKSLYVSDLAYPFVENAFPDLIDFYGEDTQVGAAMEGYAPQTITTDVMTPDLQTVLGRATATIEYPHDPPDVVNNNWAVPIGVGGGAVAQLVGDVLLCGGGLCSTPGGTQADAPLLITYAAPSGGALVYTSFHNERQATLNQDMEAIMRFLIFQL